MKYKKPQDTGCKEGKTYGILPPFPFSTPPPSPFNPHCPSPSLPFPYTPSLTIPPSPSLPLPSFPPPLLLPGAHLRTLSQYAEF